MLTSICRYAAGFALIVYGFAKLNGSQFTVLDSELDKPMRDVDGFWLTWHYFGYSKIYGSFIALVQIAGGLGLMFRRTALLSACVMFGMIGNIILIDIFYGVDFSATITACVIALCLSRVIYEHRAPLLALFWPAPEARTDSKRRVATRWVVRAAALILPALLTYWTANYNNRAPTPIDGVWRVESASNAAAAPTKIYFEYNRAFMTVFRYAGHSTEHHFEVAHPRRVRIWNRWLAKGPQLLEGSFDQTARRIELRGRLADGQPVQMVLVRER